MRAERAHFSARIHFLPIAGRSRITGKPMDKTTFDALELAHFVEVAQKLHESKALISVKDDLLIPRVYCAEEIKDWLHATVRSWAADRPGRMIEAG